MSDTTPRHDDHPVDPTAPFEPVDDAAPTTEHPVQSMQTEQTEVVPELPPLEAQPVPAALPPVPPAAGAPAPEAPAPGAPTPPGYALAPAPMKPTDERTAGMAAHGITLAATIFSSGFLGFVCALVMYLVFRDRGPFVRSHAANALNIQIMAGIVMLISLPLMLVLVGFLTFGAAVVWAIVMHIIGAVKANNGEWWSPALTPQFVK